MTDLINEMYDNGHDADSFGDNDDDFENEVNHVTNNEAKIMIKELIIIK